MIATVSQKQMIRLRRAERACLTAISVSPNLRKESKRRAVGTGTSHIPRLGVLLDVYPRQLDVVDGFVLLGDQDRHLQNG